MSPKIHTWTSGGLRRTVTTHCGDLGEDACADLHNEAITFWEGVYPPD